MAKFRFVQWLMGWLESQPVFAFEWDEGNQTKSLYKHAITCDEAESVFYQAEAIRVLGEQVAPEVDEPRYGLFGMTITGKRVFLCFTLRGTGIRIISVRKLNKREAILYAKICEE